MADQFIAIDEPAVIDKKLDTEELTVGANTVQRERIIIAGLAAGDLAPVSPTAGVKVDLGADNDVRLTDGTDVANVTADGKLETETDLPADNTGSGSITAAGQTVEVTVSKGRSGFGWQITGTWVGTIVFEVVLNGVDFVTHSVYSVVGKDAVESTTGNGIFLTGISAAQKIRVRASSWTSGTATVAHARSQAAGQSVIVKSALPSGSNNIGKVDARVRNAADSGYIEPSTLGEQQTQTTALQLIDDVVHALNAALGKAAAIAGQLDDAATTAATEDNVAPLRITAQRAAHVNLRNNAGTEVGTAGAPVRTDPTGTTSQPISIAAETANRVEVQGDVAHDITAAGNPVLVGGRANQNEPTAVQDGDAVYAWRDQQGRAVAVLNFPANTAADDTHGPKRINKTTSGETTMLAAPGAGQSIHITMLIYSNNSTTKTRCLFKEGAAGTTRTAVTGAADGGGAVIPFNPPWKLPANTALVVDFSGANDGDVTAHYFVAP